MRLAYTSLLEHHDMPTAPSTGLAVAFTEQVATVEIDRRPSANFDLDLITALAPTGDTIVDDAAVCAVDAALAGRHVCAPARRWPARQRSRTDPRRNACMHRRCGSSWPAHRSVRYGRSSRCRPETCSARTTSASQKWSRFLREPQLAASAPGRRYHRTPPAVRAICTAADLLLTGSRNRVK
jgi:hypothetical protein